MEKLLLRPSEVAELIGLGRSKTYDLIAKGLLPSVRVGRAVRVSANSLRQWIDGLQGATEKPSKSAPKTAHSSELAQSSRSLSTEI